jgi:hypothetical protein
MYTYILTTLTCIHLYISRPSSDEDTEEQELETSSAHGMGGGGMEEASFSQAKIRKK